VEELRRRARARGAEVRSRPRPRARAPTRRRARARARTGVSTQPKRATPEGKACTTPRVWTTRSCMSTSSPSSFCGKTGRPRPSQVQRDSPRLCDGVRRTLGRVPPQRERHGRRRARGKGAPRPNRLHAVEDVPVTRTRTRTATRRTTWTRTSTRRWTPRWRLRAILDPPQTRKRPGLKRHRAWWRLASPPQHPWRSRPERLHPRCQRPSLAPNPPRLVARVSDSVTDEAGAEVGNGDTRHRALKVGRQSVVPAAGGLGTLERITSSDAAVANSPSARLYPEDVVPKAVPAAINAAQRA